MDSLDWDLQDFVFVMFWNWVCKINCFYVKTSLCVFKHQALTKYKRMGSSFLKVLYPCVEYNEIW